MIIEAGRLQIKLKFSFVAAVTLMMYFCEEKVVLNAFFASLIHESGHLAFMILYRAVPQKIEFGVFGICIERREALLLGYKKEAVIALGGIIFNLTVAAASFLLSHLFFKEELILFSAVNLMVATVNSLPDSFLDMGRALSFFLLSVTDEEKADRVMSAISAFTVTGLSFFSVCYTICEGLNLSLIAVTLYLIIITFKRKVDK